MTLIFVENLTACEKQRQDLLNTAPIINGKPLVLPGAFMPQCKENGDFEETQCHGSTGYCWCVDELGNKIEGTSIRFKKPECKRSKLFDAMIFLYG